MRNLLLAAAVLLAGCDASTFNSVNATVVSTRQVSAQANGVALPGGGDRRRPGRRRADQGARHQLGARRPDRHAQRAPAGAHGPRLR